MDELLKNLMNDDDGDDEETQRGLGTLGGLLGSLLGGAGGQMMAPTGSAAEPEAGSLASLLGGSSTQPAAPSAQPDSSGGLADLLGMLGGGAAGAQPSAPVQQQAPSLGGGGLGALLGMMGGAGGSAAQAPQAGGLLGMLLGGLLGSGMSSNPMLGGISSAIAKKLGVSETVANMIVIAAVGLLLQSLQKRAASRQEPGQGLALDSESLDAPELGDMLRTLGGSDTAASRIATGNATRHLVEQAGIEPQVAEEGLQEAFRLLAGQLGN
ncbi:MAG: hypothetical protein ACOX2L_11370 [Anaerolineae bacterium]|jgi:hypothetical protein|nr:hypothetical protein [Chloroflexota bacterium]